jgi:hypothetical protein
MAANSNFYHFLFCWATGISQQLASTVGLHVTRYFRTTPQFETGDARYSWLNRSIFVAEGRIAPGGVEYKVYRGV